MSAVLATEAFYNGDDWLIAGRSGAAKGGLFGQRFVEAMYPIPATEAAGAPLTAAGTSNTITLHARPVAEVNCVWSVDDCRRKETENVLVKNKVKSENSQLLRCSYGDVFQKEERRISLTFVH